MMRCEQLVANGAALETADRSLPVPGPREALVEIDHCGVCHSDLHLQDGYFDFGDGQYFDISRQRKLPLVLGHEIAGRVVATGSDTRNDFDDRLVAVYPWIGCGDCGLCRRGDEHLCNRPRALGSNVDGGFATHVLVPDTRYLLDLAGIDTPAAGCLMCSGLTAYSALQKAARFLPGGPLVIVGAGGVGLTALRFAAAMQLGTVYAVDVSEQARAAALDLGATAAIDPGDADAAKALKKAGGAGAVVDFVGSDRSLGFAQRLAAKGGGIIVVGLMGGSLTLPVPLLPFSAITIQGSYVGSLDEARALLELVRSGTVDRIPFIERPLGETNAALDSLRAGQVVGRTVIRP